MQLRKVADWNLRFLRVVMHASTIIILSHNLCGDIPLMKWDKCRKIEETAGTKLKYEFTFEAKTFNRQKRLNVCKWY